MTAGDPGAQIVTVEEAATLFAPLADQDVLVALSGGADSVALLWLMARWAGAGRLVAATVDHGLRESSDLEARQAGAFARSLGVPHTVLTWVGTKPSSGIEAAARKARYTLLEEHAAEVRAGWLVTAHTEDDQAETVLLRLAAGSGPSGLQGMRPVVQKPSGLNHFRPLLQISKSRLLKTIQENDLVWFEDPMNADPVFARVRLRQAAGPLAREGLTARRLATLARRMGRLDSAVELAVDEAWQRWATREEGGIHLAAQVMKLPDEILLRLLRRALVSDVDILSVRLERLEVLLDQLKSAADAGRTLGKTLAGMKVELSSSGVRITAAPPRRPRSSIVK